MKVTDMNGPEASGDFVEVWFKLVKSADGYPKSQDWEELWAKPNGQEYTVSSIPFFENRVSRGDSIQVTKNAEGFLQFTEVVSRGGHSTFRAYIDLEKTGVQQFAAALKSMGADCEVTLKNLVACDVPRDVMSGVGEYLVRGAEEKKWGLQDGFIFEAQPKELSS